MWPKLEILSAVDGKIKAKLRVEDEHTDSQGCLHIGFIASTVDKISALALVTHLREFISAVSIDLHIR